MSRLRTLKSLLIGGAAIAAVSPAHANSFDIPGGDLGPALSAYSRDTGIELLYLDEQLKGVHTRGAQGDLTATAALSRILAGTGFAMQQEASAVAIVRAKSPEMVTRTVDQSAPVRLASAHSARRCRRRNGCGHVVEDQRRYPDGSDCDYGAEPGAAYVAARSRAGRIL